ETGSAAESADPMETRKRRGSPQDLGKASMRNSRLYHTFHKRRRRRPQPNATLTGTGFGTAVFFHEKLPTTNREDRAKEGRTRHQVNGSVPLEARPGWFVQLPITGGLNQPPRLRPRRRLRGIFLMGAATPPCPRRGLRLSLQLFSIPPCPAKDVGHGKLAKEGDIWGSTKFSPTAPTGKSHV